MWSGVPLAMLSHHLAQKHTLFLGDPHQYTVLSELMESLVNEMDKLRVEAQQRESEADKLVKDTIAALKKWDEKTEELVSQLQQARDEHVSKQNCVVLNKFCLSWCIHWLNKFCRVYSQVNAKEYSQ